MNMRRCYWLVAIVAAALIGGCGGGEEVPPLAQPSAVVSAPGSPGLEEGGPASGPLTATLLPEAPSVETDLRLVVSGAGAGKVDCVWRRNGELVEPSGSCLPQGSFVKGDVVSVTVSSDAERASASVTVANSPPKVLSVPFKNPYVHAGVDIEALPEGVDLDGDTLEYRYFWSVNGEELPWERGAILAGDRFKKGDRVKLDVVPFDGSDEGQTFHGQAFVVPNAPPQFVTVPPAAFQARTYSYAARAEDADGDPLTYALESGPAGMTIDPQSGAVAWTIGAGDAGEHLVRIVAEDSDGARAVQEYNLNLELSD